MSKHYTKAVQVYVRLAHAESIADSCGGFRLWPSQALLKNTYLAVTLPGWVKDVLADQHYFLGKAGPFAPKYYLRTDAWP